MAKATVIKGNKVLKVEEERVPFFQNDGYGLLKDGKITYTKGEATLKAEIIQLTGSLNAKTAELAAAAKAKITPKQLEDAKAELPEGALAADGVKVLNDKIVELEGKLKDK